jgi:hypothetical protein
LNDGGNVIELISPVGHPRVEAQAQRRSLDTPVGRRMGIIWNQYQATRQFWPRLERALEEVCKPSSVERAYKSNTWMPLDKAKFSELAGAVDYLVIGVGA